MTISVSHREHPVIVDARRQHAFYIEHAKGSSPLTRDCQKNLKKYTMLAREVVAAMQHLGCALHVGASSSGRLTAKLPDGGRISTPVIVLLALEDEHVVPDTDDLFSDALPAVWRWQATTQQ
jgi:hypothetical protein